MSTRDVIVHFEGIYGWSAMVSIVGNDRVTVLEVIEKALEEFNLRVSMSNQVTSDQLRLRLLDVIEPVVPVTHPELEHVTSPRLEISALLPSFEEWEQLLPASRRSSRALKDIEKATILMERGEYAAARDRMRGAERIAVDSELWRRYQEVYAGFEGLIERGFEVVKANQSVENIVQVPTSMFEMSDKAFGRQRFIEDIIDDIDDGTKRDDETILKDLMTISEDNGNVAIQLVLRHPTLFRFLPRMCDENPSCRMQFLTIVVASDSCPTDLVELAVTFVDAGNIDISAELLSVYNSRRCDVPVLYKYAKLLLMDNRVGRLITALHAFFDGTGKTLSRCSGAIERVLDEIRYAYMLPETWPKMITCDEQKEKDNITPAEKSIVPLMAMVSVMCVFSRAFDCYYHANKIIQRLGTDIKDEEGRMMMRLHSYAGYVCERTTAQKVVIDKVAVLGDETALFLAFQNTADQGDILPFVIPSLKIWDLADMKNSVAKTAFWNRIGEMDGYETLILCIGREDIGTTLPAWLMRDSEATCESVFESLINVLNGAIEAITKRWPDIDVIVHNVFIDKSMDRNLVALFNNMLSELLPESVGLISIDQEISKLLAFRRGDKDTYGNAVREALASRNSQ